MNEETMNPEKTMPVQHDDVAEMTHASEHYTGENIQVLKGLEAVRVLPVFGIEKEIFAIKNC